jgi:hypothetical protein
MSFNYNDYGFLPFVVPQTAPPSDGSHPVGFPAGRLVPEFWTAKTYSLAVAWNYEPNIIPGAVITWNFNTTFPALASPTPPMAERVVQPWNSQLTYNGYTSGEESDEVQAFVLINWEDCYENAGLWYPYMEIAVGGVDANQVTNTGTNPTGVTATIFGQAVTLYDDTTGIDGGPKTGRIVLETTEYWS